MGTEGIRDKEDIEARGNREDRKDIAEKGQRGLIETRGYCREEEG
jgi:hypothetical protein